MTRKMKDSGVEWIGEIPEDWEITTLKNVLFDKVEKNDSDNPIVLSLARSGIKVRDISTNEGQLAESYLNYNKVTYGDLLLNPMDLISGANCNISEVEGVISPAYFNLNPINKNNIYYYGYYFKLQYWHMVLFAHGKGVSFENRWTLNRETLLNYYLPLPPICQQKSIVDFLDKKTQEIDNIISKTKKAIEEYKKYKQSLITETVTKGLDKNVQMKDSGIKWMGNIPGHWNIIKFRDLFKFGSGLTITKSDLVDEGIRVINYGEIHSKYKFDLDINRDELKCVDKSYLENRKIALINKGDFVFCDTSEDREGSGNCIVLRENNDELIFAGSHTVTARLIRNENPIYIRYMIMASSVKEQISSNVVGIKVYSITQAILKTIIGVIPPLKEQEQIATYLDKKTKQIGQIISTKEKLLTEMEAYKKSLIYEVITGKREVE